jgi:hypothetical protein
MDRLYVCAWTSPLDILGNDEVLRRIVTGTLDSALWTRSTVRHVGGANLVANRRPTSRKEAPG